MPHLWLILHPMITRACDGITRPINCLNLHVSSISPLPQTYSLAIRDPNWKSAMCDEYNALIKNHTWTLIPRPVDANIVRSMWLFQHKHNADGTLSLCKARLVANGHSQQIGVYCDETFSLVVKPATICTVLSLALSQNWLVHQLDIKIAFLHGDLIETIYMHQPPRFRDPEHPDYFCLFRCDSSLFIYRRGSYVGYLLLYVDDIIMTASSTTFFQHIIKPFDMTDTDGFIRAVSLDHKASESADQGSE
ncbi:uncharacterized mitochondrial protein AtMg00820-like [Rutidosis leptorrhynchoides]|uniref:uncharacterized mitochondrial protein AtMg00820-like n=1 Tax=Rutidosis leptorrhynchoides TaxID=125765 RepID=UPI003A9A46E2